MATILLLRFPLGRFHATPWDRHVNEGAVEIPPSPWRVLRALYAVWRTRVPELGEEVVHALLAELAVPPTFHVPRHSISHTRHYYPDAKDGTDRTLDAFAVVGTRAEMAVVWPGALPDASRSALERLAASVPYFGRADSLCEASVPSQWQPDPAGHETWSPLDVALDVPRNAPGTAVLAPELPLRVEALLARPADVRRGGLLFPAGSRLVGYLRSRAVPPPPRRSVTRTAAPTAVRFSVLQSACPPETDALVYTDLLRHAALSKLRADPADRPHTLLGGRTVADEKMTGHEHAHYLPVFENRSLTGLVVWVPAGLPRTELDAMVKVSRLRSSWEKDWRLDVLVAGHGPVETIAPDLRGPATVWRSVTPFVPSRYPKSSDTVGGYVEREIGAELSHRSLPELRSVRPVPGRDVREFVRHRPSRRSSRVNRPAFLLELAFHDAVPGPLTLGHLSHFGLGLFNPVPGA